MYGYYGRRKKKSALKLKVCIGIALVIFIAIPICKSYYSEKSYNAVTVTDKDIKNYRGSSKFLVFTKTENGTTRVFSIKDTVVMGRLNSADDYADIEVGETYTFTVIGWRVPLISAFENIIEFEKQ